MKCKFYRLTDQVGSRFFLGTSKQKQPFYPPVVYAKGNAFIRKGVLWQPTYKIDQ